MFPPIPATFTPNVVYGDAAHLQQGFLDIPYDVPNLRLENGPAPNHVRIGWYRSVYNIPHAFAVCSFADELAVAAGKDPVEHLRELLGAPRKIDLKAMGVDPFERLAINPRRSRIRAAAAIGFKQDVLATDLVPKGVEAEGWFSLSFRLQRGLQLLNRFRRRS